jgi:DNA-binding response OmpR family regulator
MNSARILLVEDDLFLAEQLRRLLEEHHHQCLVAHTAEQALQTITQQSVDLIILDLGLPDVDGIDLCRRLRSRWTMPVLILTARSDALDKVVGLEVGADDYLTKPFEPKELLARVRALLRRAYEYGGKSQAAPDTVVRVDALEIDLEGRCVYRAGERVPMTRIEFDLLAELVRHANKPLHRDTLFEKVWGYDSEFNTNSLEVIIYRLRKKLEPDPSRPRYIITVRGFGYQFSTVSPHRASKRSEP